MINTGDVQAAADRLRVFLRPMRRTGPQDAYVHGYRDGLADATFTPAERRAIRAALVHHWHATHRLGMNPAAPDEVDAFNKLLARFDA